MCRVEKFVDFLEQAGRREGREVLGWREKNMRFMSRRRKVKFRKMRWICWKNVRGQDF